MGGPGEELEDKVQQEARKKAQAQATSTEFEEMVEAQKQAGLGVKAGEVVALLRGAGVDPAKIAEIQANPSYMLMLQNSPELIDRLAQQFPAAYAINYYQQRQAMGFGMEPVDTEFNPEVRAHRQFAAPTTATGAQEFEGGVIVDFASGTVAFPPNDASLMGSPAWMAQIPRWSDEQKQTWAKTLKQNGYIDSLKVDLVTFTDAMALYHKNRYLYGGGEPVDVSAGKAGITKDDFGGILDPAVVDTQVIAYHKEIYGANDEPSAEELKRGREFLTRTAMRIARNRDLAPADAADVAKARLQERVLADPVTRKWQELEETDTSLHDSFVNLFQVLSR